MRSILALSLPYLLCVLCACPLKLQGSGQASGSASVKFPDPPENTDSPTFTQDLSACASGDASGDLQIVQDLEDSYHEMIICGGLSYQMSGSVVDILLNAAIGKATGGPGLVYQGNGDYQAGNVMTVGFYLGSDTTFGKAGDKILFNLLDLGTYFTGFKITAKASVNLSGETHQSLEISFENPGPGIELLGLGPNPTSPIKADAQTISDNLGKMTIGSDIAVDNQHGDTHVLYTLHGPGTPAGDVWGHAPQQMELVSITATRGAQSVTVTNWGMQFQPGDSGTLDGTIDMEIRGGSFPYAAHFGYPHRKTPDKALSCL